MKFSVAFKSIVRLESFFLLSIVAWAAVARAEAPVYRCGNEYVASIKDSKNGGCKLMEGGNFINTYPPRTSAGNTANAPVKIASTSPQSSSSNSPRNDSAEQKTRDSDSRGILESELKKAEARQAELLKEYNNGEPDRNALDIKNPQRYVDRIAELKANIARNDSDIAGIKRELGRNPGSTTGNSGKSN